MMETNGPNDTLVAAIKHYLHQSGELLKLISQQPNANNLLAVKLAPDAFDTGLHLAIAIQFAARALCVQTGSPVPEIIEPYSLKTLKLLFEDVSAAIDTAPAIKWDNDVTHIAGEAKLTQQAADYVARFAFPNILFHLSQAYAGLRHAGLEIGKANFDGFHRY